MAEAGVDFRAAEEVAAASAALAAAALEAVEPAEAGRLKII